MNFTFVGLDLFMVLPQLANNTRLNLVGCQKFLPKSLSFCSFSRGVESVVYGSQLMFSSFSEFKFFQSFRIPLESKDDVRFLVEIEDEFGKFQYIENAKLTDVSVTGIGSLAQGE